MLRHQIQYIVLASGNPCNVNIQEFQMEQWSQDDIKFSKNVKPLMHL